MKASKFLNTIFEGTVEVEKKRRARRLKHLLLLDNIQCRMSVKRWRLKLGIDSN